MNITLDPKYEPLVRDKLLSGEYQTAEEVISAAMQLLSEQDEDRRVVAQVDGGEPLLLDERFGPRLEMLLQEAEDSGEPLEMTSQDWDEIRREGLALIKARKSA
jgi:Arc/MetJ-type ribon-helix-helix transcriptional regulator